MSDQDPGPAISIGGSFRDPAGFVFHRDGVLYRQVNTVHAEHYDLLLGSGLYASLVDDGLLIRHEEVDPSLAAGPGAHRILRPEPLPFVSYPYEWCFGQLRDAALLTLRVQRRLLLSGMSLRDASAYNVQFLGSRPVFVDTLSFERYREGRPWVAYRQFCQHFLAPLAVMARRDVRLSQLLLSNLGGLPLDLAVRLLPLRARLRPSLLLHLVLHARAQRRAGGAWPRGSQGEPGGRTGPRGEPTRRGGRPFTRRAFEGLLESLERAVGRLRWEPSSSWAGYYGERESYTQEAAEHKRELVAKLVEEAGPGTVWDLGANTGELSRVPSDRGIATVAFDSDPAAVEIAYRSASQRRDPHLLPLVIDLAEPSPATGWENRERMTLAERGPADLVMALALVHHLAIGNNVPLAGLAEFFSALGRWLLIEWIPKDDPKVSEMLALRDDVFPDHTIEAFEGAFGGRFETVRREEIRGSRRVLYLMRARG